MRQIHCNVKNIMTNFATLNFSGINSDTEKCLSDLKNCYKNVDKEMQKALARK